MLHSTTAVIPNISHMSLYNRNIPCHQILNGKNMFHCHFLYKKHENTQHKGDKHHDDGHQMETFSALLAFCAGNSPVNSPHKGQWRGASMFSSICAWINGWVNNSEASDLRCHHTHYDIIVMVPVETFSRLYGHDTTREDLDLGCYMYMYNVYGVTRPQWIKTHSTWMYKILMRHWVIRY